MTLANVRGNEMPGIEAILMTNHTAAATLRNGFARADKWGARITGFAGESVSRRWNCCSGKVCAPVSKRRWRRTASPRILRTLLELRRKDGSGNCENEHDGGCCD